MIFYNPHIDDFLAEPIQFRLLRRRALKKYGFMFDQARKDGISISVLVDGTASGLIPEFFFHYLPLWMRLLLSNLEYWLWKRINNFGNEVKRIAIPRSPVDEVLFAFSYKGATGNFQLREVTLKYFRTVVFHLSHYFLATSEKSANIQCLPNAYLAGDCDVSENEYFKKYFDWYEKPFLVLPFSIEGRFVNRMDWLARDAKALATGSFHDLRLEVPAYKYADFIGATGETTYHPVRLAIYRAKDQLLKLVICKISPYRQYGKNRLMRILAYFQVSQKKYFSVNIVDLYNKNRYAVVGEEISGFPALGAFEAMACGCVLIAQPPYYQGLNLEPNIHYLPYDGSIEMLRNILSIGQSPDHHAISNASSNQVTRYFSSSAMYSQWASTINGIK